jgi:hypothetical protein
MWLDDRSFVSGGFSQKQPLLIADLADSNGINWLGLGIGHEIEVVLDQDRAHATVINDYYQPAFNSFTNGSLSYQLPEISPGQHTLSLRAWDMFDNSSTKEITFYISEPPALTVTNVKTAPNPMGEYTRFIFQPNQSSAEGLDLTIRIYSLQGLLLRTINTYWPASLTTLPFISWDGTDSGGQKLKNGLYPYKISFAGKDGSYYETSQKLVILR